VEVVMDELDRILADSVPWTSVDDPGVRRSISAMSVSAAVAARTRKRAASVRGRRLATGVVAALLGLGGVGVAAATTGGWWGGQGEPELLLQNTGLADDCLAGFRVTEEGNADADVVAAARAALQGVRAADLDLAATEQSMRSKGLLHDDTPEAERWQHVLSTAVHRQIETALLERGLDPVGEWGLLGHSECSGGTE
jgi:hypothetical protein